MDKKSGFVALIGKPNAGKSTLLNTLIGTDLSIVTPKPQTTRKEVIGILTEKEYQIVFVDTPGIIKPRYKLQESMMEVIPNALQSADILLILIEVDDVKKSDTPLHSESLRLINSFDVPKIAILTKIDLCKSNLEIIPLLEKVAAIANFNEIIPISSKQNTNLEPVLKSILKYLPKSEFYYDEESLSTQNNKFFASEIIREQIFLLTEEEVPYSTEVQITEFTERENRKWYIGADIIVEKQTQKQIVIGKSGNLIKQIGLQSRLKIEEFIGHEVFLELFVKVRSDWRNNTGHLKSFGY